MNDTPARLLTLLSLLQTPREWPGSELAERLGVSARTIRRDIERLRDLGYPVEATLGAVGGYRLVAGAAMPPLLLDDEEASVRALAKLEQVLPARLRRRVGALQSATVAVTRGDGPSVDPRTLTAMAAAVAGPERLRFAYRARDGVDSRRLVEPYRLVSTGSRWYLVAFDLEREDWRTFRVDRVSEPFPTGARFSPRPLPMEAAEFVRRGLRGAETYPADVSFAAPPQELPGWLREWAVAEGPGSRVRFESGDGPEWLAARMALTGLEFTVRGPEFLVRAAAALATRLAGAASAPSGGTGPAGPA